MIDPALVERPDMVAELRALLAQVPRGRVTTYGRLAEALGSLSATKWVGYWLLHHEHDAGCPCHRVVRVDGRLGAYVVGTDEKSSRLRAEGVEVAADRVDLARFGRSELAGNRPLARLRAAQEGLCGRLRLVDPAAWPRLVAGVDVSYVSDGEGVAAYALVDVESGRFVWSTTVRAATPFPYISTFLSFRELPLLLRVIDAARAADRLADVVLVDGTGILHPRRMGIAAHLGVVSELPTIGVTKTLLCGTVEMGISTFFSGKCTYPHFISDAGETIGCAVRPTPQARVPLYVSPGNHVSVAFAGRLVQQLLRGHRLPEPLYWADRLSRAEARRARGV